MNRSRIGSHSAQQPSVRYESSNRSGPPGHNAESQSPDAERPTLSAAPSRASSPEPSRVTFTSPERESVSGIEQVSVVQSPQRSSTAIARRNTLVAMAVSGSNGVPHKELSVCIGLLFVALMHVVRPTNSTIQNALRKYSSLCTLHNYKLEVSYN